MIGEKKEEKKKIEQAGTCSKFVFVFVFVFLFCSFVVYCNNKKF